MVVSAVNERGVMGQGEITPEECFESWMGRNSSCHTQGIVSDEGVCDGRSHRHTEKSRAKHSTVFELSRTSSS